MLRGITVVVIVSFSMGAFLLHAQDTTTQPTLDTTNIALQPVVSGLRWVTTMTNAGDGSQRMFLGMRYGLIRVIRDDTLVMRPFLDVSSLLPLLEAEKGLFSIAFHPNYEENGRFFITYSDKNGDFVLAEYRVDNDNPDIADPDSGKILLVVRHPDGRHYGGQLAFGPDGYLYVSLGDGGLDEPTAPFKPQSLDSLIGKILRLDVDSGSPYAIPPDNPFVRQHSDNEDVRPEIWALGLRNPWYFSFDTVTGDLYIADVGLADREEINFQEAGSPGGQNYGWNFYEGTMAIGEPDAATLENIVMPVLDYDHDMGCAIMGGYVYRGRLVPQLEGRYIYGDYCTSKIWAAQRNVDGEWESTLLLDADYINLAAFGQDESGEIYVAAYQDGIVARLITE